MDDSDESLKLSFTECVGIASSNLPNSKPSAPALTLGVVQALSFNQRLLSDVRLKMIERPISEIGVPGEKSSEEQARQRANLTLGPLKYLWKT